MNTKLSSINQLTELGKLENREFLAEFTDITHSKKQPYLFTGTGTTINLDLIHKQLFFFGLVK